MANHRTRVKGGKKGRQRWGKGQSGASNPSKTKFRDAAKARLLRGQGFGKQKPSVEGTIPLNELDTSSGFVGGSGGKDFPTKLTAECLLRHEAVFGQAGSSTGGSTGRTLCNKKNKIQRSQGLPKFPILAKSPFILSS